VTYIIVGGSSGLGRALAERFAAAGCELVLVSRDIRDTQPLASHLAIKYSIKASPVALDLNCSPLPFDTLDRALEGHRPLKGLLLPAGINDDEDLVGLSDEKLEFLTRVNFLSPCEILNHYLPRLEQNAGVIAGFGSVATARGRSRNAAYAGAKRALESYFESLMHYAANRELSCQYYVLGYLDTNLAFSQTLLFPLASPDRVANVVFQNQFTTGRRFLPRPWYVLYRVVQMLPWVIFKRLSF
jgi:decaprenylphospho-beta-D-erythro-pentofuranosid-2-ulose 2-reductase